MIETQKSGSKTSSGEIDLVSFQEYVSKGITYPVVYSDLVYKLRRV